MFTVRTTNSFLLIWSQIHLFAMFNIILFHLTDTLIQAYFWRLVCFYAVFHAHINIVQLIVNESVCVTISPCGFASEITLLLLIVNRKKIKSKMYVVYCHSAAKCRGMISGHSCLIMSVCWWTCCKVKGVNQMWRCFSYSITQRILQK